jgi:hypothetical protein
MRRLRTSVVLSILLNHLPRSGPSFILFAERTMNEAITMKLDGIEGEPACDHDA